MHVFQLVKLFNKIIFAFVHYSHDIQFLEEEENKDFYGVAGQNVTMVYVLVTKFTKFCEFLGFILMEECCLINGVPLMLRWNVHLAASWVVPGALCILQPSCWLLHVFSPSIFFSQMIICNAYYVSNHKDLMLFFCTKLVSNVNVHCLLICRLNLKIHVVQERNCLFWILTIHCLITDPQQRIHLNSCGHVSS